VNEIIRLPRWAAHVDVVRRAWVSQQAKDVWEPRVQAVGEALAKLEVESVYHRVRHSAMVFKMPDEMVAFSLEVGRHGCSAITLDTHGVDTLAYSSNTTAVEKDKPFKYRVVVTREPKKWAKVYRKDADEVALGKLLGFPECCSRFYAQAWVQDKWTDTTVPMSADGAAGPPEGNILLRWAGVRLVRHLPCSFNCEASAKVGKETLALGRKLGYAKEMNWALEMLSWPMEYSSRNGIAIITTPVFKVVTTTDPLGATYVLRRHSDVYPEEGARALHFPFQSVSKRKVTESKSHKAATEVDSWTDNGFSSKRAMLDAHDVLMSVAPGSSDLSIRAVLDLGCGNGVLLQRAAMRWPGVQLNGVELAPDRWRSAESRIPGDVRPGNIADLSLWPDVYDLAFFMPGRLNEMSTTQQNAVLDQLGKVPQVVLYAYGDQVGKADFSVLGSRGYHQQGHTHNEAAGTVASLWVKKP
jgi:hypothetical protein